MQVTVQAVIVPPFRAGVAYGHTADGACIRFSGSRASMLVLCDDVKARAAVAGAPLTVDAADFEALEEIQLADCPLHCVSAA
jgi:hypothetical protein